MTLSRIIRLSLACLGLSISTSAAFAACAVSGSPSYSGQYLTDSNGNPFYTETGGSGSISINFTAATGCTYYVGSNSSWLTSSVTSATSNSGTATSVSVGIAANSTSTGYRSGSLTVYVNGAAVTTFSVDENSSRCSTVITSANPATAPAAGTTGSFSFTSGGCLYTGLSSTATWLSVTSYGPSTIGYSVAANTGAARSASLSFDDPHGQSFTVNQVAAGPVAQPPTVTSISPNSGSPGSTISASLSGTNFTQGAVVQTSGSGLTVTGVSVVGTTQINMTLTIAQTATQGNVSFSVVTTAGSSNAVSFSISAPSTPVTLSSINPTSAVAGGSAFVLTASGTGFSPGAVISFASSSLSTTFVSSAQLTAVVPSNLVAAPGSALVTVSSGSSTTTGLLFTIGSNPLTINCTPSTGPATTHVSYAANCSASGGTSPYSWSITGSLPAGLTQGSTTGSTFTLSGAPTAAGPYGYSITVTDSESPAQSKSQSYSGTVVTPAPSITSLNCSSAAGPATVGVIYSNTCTAPNGTAPFTWSIGAGALPAGLSYNASGTSITVSGNPSAAGAYSYTLKVTDSTSPSPLSGSTTFSGSIAPAGTATLSAAPTGLNFTYRPDLSAPTQQSISVFTTGATTNFSASASANWLSVSPSSGQTPGSVSVSVVNPSNLAPGTYSGQVTISAPSINPPSITIQVTLSVQSVPAPHLTVSQSQLTYGLTTGSTPVQQQLVVSNSGGGSVNFTTQVTGCSCVSVGSGSGQTTAGAPSVLGFQVDPTGLPPSTYASAIVINGSDGEKITVPVTTAVNSQPQSIVLTQTGLTFGAVAQGVAPPSQTLGIINAGQGAMVWNVNTNTLSGGSWLSATPASGTSNAGAGASLITVSVNPTGLTAGQYYGFVQVSAANAGNSPQVISVLLDVVDPSQGFAVVTPVGAVIGSVSGQTVSGPITIYNLATQPVNYSTATSTTDGGKWISVSPASGTIAAGGSAKLTLSPVVASLPTGSGNGLVSIGFSNGAVQDVNISSLLYANTSQSLRTARPEISNCSTTAITATFTSLSPGTIVTSGQKVPLTVSIVDNCNNPISTATVTAGFTAGSNLTLVSQGNGVYSNSWTPGAASSQFTVAAVASFPTASKPLSSNPAVTVIVQAPAPTNAPNPTSAQNSAWVNNSAPISPGSWVTIFGDRLASSALASSGSTFPLQIATTQVLLGTTSLPLNFVGPSQVNALLPLSLTPNSTVTLNVQRDQTAGTIPITLADVGPAIFATNGAGTGQGAVLVATAGVIAAPVGAFAGSQPVNRGDYIAIFCTGLGAVDQNIANGQAGPSSPPANTLATPAVMVGGIQAPVTFSGLAPGLVGLYQINAQVPATVTPGDAVSLNFTIGRDTSNTVTIAVK